MKTVLIVDDSESVRELVSFSLEEHGFKIIKGENGIDAMKHINNNEKIDIIITDLHMPIMNGIEFIKKVREKDFYMGIPILFLTTEIQSEKKMEAKHAGATGWLVKPFAPEKLLATLNKVIK